MCVCVCVCVEGVEGGGDSNMHMNLIITKHSMKKHSIKVREREDKGSWIRVERTWHTEAIVLKQSVVFSSIREGFCREGRVECEEGKRRMEMEGGKERGEGHQLLQSKSALM